MADFEQAVQILFEQEGGFTADNNDPTDYGISLHFLEDLGPELGDINHDGFINQQDILALTKAEATDLYFHEFWLKYQMQNINDQETANALLSFCVNMGPAQALKLFQRAIRDVSARTLLKIDGIMGPKTLRAANGIDGEHLLPAFLLRVRVFYVQLVKAKPELKVNLAGWLNRVKYFAQ
jgi:lysozyme family protein